MMSGKKKKKIRFRYDSEADGYDELYSDEQRTKYELALRRIAISRQDRILDCGCGTGIFLEKVAGNVQFAVGGGLRGFSVCAHQENPTTFMVRPITLNQGFRNFLRAPQIVFI
jgi:SAM-dependent methyltransferase